MPKNSDQSQVFWPFVPLGEILKAWHLELLRDPKTKSELTLEIVSADGDEILEGFLRSETSQYRITNGIPRFVENEGYSANFGWQWKKWAKVQYESENVGRPMEGWTDNMFFKATQFGRASLEGKLILDIGCGGGRFGDRVIANGGKLVALDYSEAVDVARDYLFDLAPDTLFVQGDALNLPLADGVFDDAYSIGVLHHTPDPSQGVAEAHRILKPGGTFALSVYPKGGYYGWPNVTLWRTIFNAIPEKIRFKAALRYSEILCTTLQPIANFWRPLTYPIRAFLPTVYLADLRWSILDTFDSLTTSFQSTHTFPEARLWFTNSGYSSVIEGPWGCNPIGGKTGL